MYFRIHARYMDMTKASGHITLSDSIIKQEQSTKHLTLIHAEFCLKQTVCMHQCINHTAQIFLYMFKQNVFHINSLLDGIIYFLCYFHSFTRSMTSTVLIGVIDICSAIPTNV